MSGAERCVNPKCKDYPYIHEGMCDLKMTDQAGRMNGQASFWETAGPNRYAPAQLWYDSTDRRLVVLVDGKEVPVVEPVLPGMEVVPEVVHVQWNDPVTPRNAAHIDGCAECRGKFGSNPFVGIPQAGGAAWSTKKP